VVKPKRKRKGVGVEEEEERLRSYRTRAKKRESMDAKGGCLKIFHGTRSFHLVYEIGTASILFQCWNSCITRK
jgi:hypothetical protein